MPELFTELDGINHQTIQDFTALLSELSSSFADRAPDEQAAAAEQNLTAVLSTENAFVLVHRDPETKRIVATATGNVVLGREAWVDDVVTLASYRGRGLGRESMDALHERFREADATTVRLTSKPIRDAAGNLYTSMGYVEGGTVWRNPNAAEYSGVSSDSDSYFTPVNCPIPTGNKAWLYGPYAGSAADQAAYPHAIKAAAGELAAEGITSVNYFSAAAEGAMDPQLRDALQATSFALRNTRLYTLDLESA